MLKYNIFSSEMLNFVCFFKSFFKRSGFDGKSLFIKISTIKNEIISI